MIKTPEQDEFGWFWVCAWEGARNEPSILSWYIWKSLTNIDLICDKCGSTGFGSKLRKYYKTKEAAEKDLEDTIEHLRYVIEDMSKPSF